MSQEKSLISKLGYLIRLVWVLIICVVGSTALLVSDSLDLLKREPANENLLASSGYSPEIKTVSDLWQAPDSSRISAHKDGPLIRYGRELIAHTAVYLGPKGKVAQISNGMNCQNCHLKAGTVPFGNNYGAVASKYPVFRSRSGTVEGFEKRVNDCIERSLNGKKLPEDSHEMKAIVAYLKWVGSNVEKGQKLPGFGLLEPALLTRPADPVKGKMVYTNYCSRCHGENGEGIMEADGTEWKYPPLFGENSFNIGAGLYRLSRFAAFVKTNMPYGVTFENPFLTDEEAWDVAAYVNSMPRPEKDLSGDWPDISKKPVDYPFGPYADTFSEERHKFGPFGPIKEVSQ